MPELPVRARNATFLLRVPYRSQLDGTPYERANCGPATLAMVLEAYGINVATHDLRLIVNMLQGSYNFDDGTGWEALEAIADDYGLTPLDLRGNTYYRKWTVEDVRRHLLAGHPVMILTNYRLLPGNGGSTFAGDHYIVITGMDGDRFIYNDSAYWGDNGYALVMDPQVLVQAWANSVLSMTAMAIGPGPDRPVLPRLLSKAFQSGRGPGGAPLNALMPTQAIATGPPLEADTPADAPKGMGSPPGDKPGNAEDDAVMSEVYFQDDDGDKASVVQDSPPAMPADGGTPVQKELIIVIGLLLLGAQALPNRFGRYL